MSAQRTLSVQAEEKLREFAFKTPADPDDYDTEAERKYAEGYERARSIVKFIIQTSDGVPHA